MRVALLAVTVPVLVLATACESPDVAPPIDTTVDAVAENAAAVAAVTAVREAEIAAISGRTGDLSWMANDAIMMPPGGPALEGIDAIRPWVDEFISQFTATADLTETEVTVSGDWAIERYVGSMTLTPTGGGEVMTDVIKGIHVYRRGADGEWKMVYDIWNSDSPPAGT